MAGIGRPDKLVEFRGCQRVFHGLLEPWRDISCSSYSVKTLPTPNISDIKYR